MSVPTSNSISISARLSLQVARKSSMPRDILQLFLLGRSDFPFDFRRTGPSPDGTDADHGPVDLGCQLDRDFPQSQKAKDPNEDHSHRHFDRVVDAIIEKVTGGWIHARFGEQASRGQVGDALE